MSLNKQRGFTLVELLAALAFMAIVIPVAMHGLAIASRAGQVAQRKAVAIRVLENALNEYVAFSGQGSSSVAQQKGSVADGPIEFRWSIRQESWREDKMRLVTCEVTYPVQGQEYSVHGSTLLGLASQ